MEGRGTSPGRPSPPARTDSPSVASPCRGDANAGLAAAAAPPDRRPAASVRAYGRRRHDPHRRGFPASVGNLAAPGAPDRSVTRGETLEEDGDEATDLGRF